LKRAKFSRLNARVKLGLVSAILPELTLDELLAYAAREGFDCLEVMCWPVGQAERKYAGVTHIDVTRFGQRQADEVKTLCAQHRVSISALGYYPNPLDPNASVARRAVEHLKKVIVAAEKLGLGNVNSFVGRDWTRSVDENWPRFLKTWRPLVRFAEDHGVKIGIENCPMLFTRDEWPGGKNLAYCPAIWRRMFSDIPSKNLGLNYDPSHLAWMQMDWLKPLAEFRDRLHHLHAKDVQLFLKRLDDVSILATPLEYHQPRVPGQGIIDWGRYVRALEGIGYDGPICIEVEDDTFGKTLAGRKRAIGSARRALRAVMKARARA
jgi:sugar phosphate isomerase/epimerase